MPWITKWPGPFRVTSAPSAATARSVAQTVLALEEALHLGEPVGERTEKRGAVRDGLVAGYGDRAGEASDGADDGVHASFSRTSRARPSSASRVVQSPRAASSRHRPRTASYARERVQQRPRFCAEDVGPERLGGRRDARRVDEAAARERQRVPVGRRTSA